MKLSKSFTAIVLSVSLSLFSFLTLPVQSVHAQDSRVALQRGYRTGYSDGYMAGYRDAIDNQTKSYARHNEYAKADRAYNKDYGTVEDYKDGYQQGFESGYDTGFEKRSFEAAIPPTLAKRGTIAVEPRVEPVAAVPVAAPVPQPVAAAAPEPVAAATEPRAAEPAVAPAISYQERSIDLPKTTFVPVSEATIIIPRDTELIVEVNQELSTDRSRIGDKFTATIVSPSEIAGAVIEGRVIKITRPGRIKRRSEMQLSFDRIVLTESRWSNFNAVLTEVLPVKGDNIKRVDDEGMAVGKRSFKEDGIKIGAATGGGLIIGAVAGGPVGAAVGAGVGAAFGVGAVVIERGKNINLNRSQQLRIKTSYETVIK